MAQAAKPAASDETIEIRMTRHFAASPREVFDAWTDPARIGRWIGSRDVTAEAKQMEARPGGAYAIVMTHLSGKVSTVRGVYREFRPPERLVFTWAWDGADGKPGPETLVTITFRAIGRETEMSFHHQHFTDAAARDMHQDGWTQSFDKLAERLAKQ